MARSFRSLRRGLIGLLAPLLLGSPGCSFTLAPPTGDLRLDLTHQDPRIRALAAKQAVTDERLDMAPLLIENLSDDDAGVRFYASIALKKLSGRDFGYLPYADRAERDAAIERWREWSRRNTPGAGTVASSGGSGESLELGGGREREDGKGGPEVPETREEK